MSRSGDWIQTYLEYTKRTEPPQLYKEWVAVSTIAAALKRKCWLEWGIDHRLFPNLYVVLVGPPGRCRKGTAMGSGESLLRDVGIKLSAKSITREALIQELESTQDVTKTSDPDPNNQYIPHASLTIFSPELTVFLGHDNKQLLMDLTDWYDCADNWEYRTKTSGENEVAGVWVNLMGATTPKLIQTALPLDAIGGGLASRIIFVYENTRGRIAAPFVSQEERDIRKKLLVDLGQIHTLSGSYTLTPEAMDCWVKWYLNMSDKPPNMPPEFEGYINRRQTHARKLAMVMSASRGDDLNITKADWDRAINLLERTEVKMPRVFAGVGASKNSTTYVTLMEYIHARKEVSVKEIYQDLYGIIESPRQFQELISMLTGQGFCKLEKSGNQTNVIYLTNHKLHSMFGGTP